jgi:hypothetical protein
VIQLNAAHRLLAAEDWWDSMPADQKKQYIKDHPNSKYAKDSIKEESGEGATQVSSEYRKATAGLIKTNSPKIAKFLKNSFPQITGATSALKHLSTRKPLTQEHKEVLKGLGDTALKTALKFAVGENKAHLAHTIGRIGAHAVKYAVDHFKEKKESSGAKGDVEVFVDSVAEGIEHADVPVDETALTEEPTAKGTPPKGAIARHVKSKAKHIAKVLDRSFPSIKPATNGLVALSRGQALDAEQKKAIKGLGKVALGMSIAALPGGLAVHIVAGAGSVALTSALNSIRKRKVPEGKILVHFVESIGQGLEDALVSKALGD